MYLGWSSVAQRGRKHKPQRIIQYYEGSATSPLSIPPSGYWEGNDGLWSTFSIGIGSPAQYVRVLISTTIIQPWAVLSEGCVAFSSPDCVDSRGGVFETNTSTTWDSLGFYDLVFEGNLGYEGNGKFGYDTVTLGLPGTGLPALDHQVVVGVETPDFYIAPWGIRPAPTNLTTVDNPITSLLSTLRNQNLVPSLSWGYTAGAYHQWQANQQGLGSLTFGGSDLALYEPNNLTFPFGVDISRDLLVWVNSISYADDRSLSLEPIQSFIDATVPHIWLPESFCDLFVATFGLLYDATLDLYTVNDTQHTILMTENASITFNLGATEPSDGNLDIVLPYEAFDLELTADYPGVANTTRYFPIRKAANSTQYTLGRTFLQHAYVIADYERGNFSVHQALFPVTGSQNLQAILPPSAQSLSANSSAPSTSPHVIISSTDIIVIAVVAAVVALGLLASGVFLVFRRRGRQQKREKAGKDSKLVASELAGKDTTELSEQVAYPVSELACSERSGELAAREFDRHAHYSWSSEGDFSVRKGSEIYELL